MVSKPLLLRTEPNRWTGELGALHETPAVGLTVQCCPGANSKPFLPKELGSGLLQALDVYAYGPDPTGLGHLFQPPPLHRGLGFEGSSAMGTWSGMKTPPLAPGLPHPAWPAHFSSKKEKKNVSRMEFQGPDRGLECESPGWRELQRRPIQAQPLCTRFWGDTPQTEVPRKPKWTGRQERGFVPRRWGCAIPTP